MEEYKLKHDKYMLACKEERDRRILAHKEEQENIRKEMALSMEANKQFIDKMDAELLKTKNLLADLKIRKDEEDKVMEDIERFAMWLGMCIEKKENHSEKKKMDTEKKEEIKEEKKGFVIKVNYNGTSFHKVEFEDGENENLSIEAYALYIRRYLALRCTELPVPPLEDIKNMISDWDGGFPHYFDEKNRRLFLIDLHQDYNVYDDQDDSDE